MTFLRQIPDGYYYITFFILIIYLFFALKNYKKEKKITKIFFKTVFLIYCFGVIYFCFLTPGFIKREISIQLVPFSSIYEIWNHSIHYTVILKQIGGNLILLFPAGFLFPIILEKDFSFKTSIIFGILISFGIETLQLFLSIIGFSYKVFDVDDIILNTIGFIFGVFIQKILKKLFSK